MPRGVFFVGNRFLKMGSQKKRRDQMMSFKKCAGCSVIALLFCFVTPCHAMDITLAWDANTEPNLAGYMVYYDTDGSGAPYDGEGAAEGDSPIDVGNVTEFTLSDLSDGQVYFFAVTAYNDENLESGYSNEVDAMSISLSQGPNLISLYRQPGDTDIASVLSSISGKYTSVWAFIDNTWRAYDPVNPGFSDLTTMDAGRGYWVEMNESATMIVTGLVASNATDLVNGSNLVGYSSVHSLDTPDAITSIEGQCVSVWAFIEGSWKVYDPANPGFSDLTTMAPGYGYWIDVSGACVWNVP
jgi:hypothetical protein